MKMPPQNVATTSAIMSARHVHTSSAQPRAGVPLPKIKTQTLTNMATLKTSKIGSWIDDGALSAFCNRACDWQIGGLGKGIICT
jgi:hypothetical protein